MYMSQHMCRSEDNLRELALSLSLSTPWISGIKLRSSSLVASALTHLAIFGALEYLLFELQMVVSHCVDAENELGSSGRTVVFLDPAATAIWILDLNFFFKKIKIKTIQ